MNTRGEIKDNIKVELSLVSTSTFVTNETLNTLVWNAYLWVAGQQPWPQLQKLKSTTTRENEGSIDYYYDYPAEFKSDSVFRLFVDGNEYSPTDFEDFLDYRENPTDTSKRIFATYGRQYFIYPTPTAVDLVIEVWGSIQPPAFASDSSKTIFSDAEEEVNEAIMRKALSQLLKRSGEASQAKSEVNEAKEIIIDAWTRIAARRQRFQKLDNPMFDVPNFFGTQEVVIGGFRNG